MSEKKLKSVLDFLIKKEFVVFNKWVVNKYPNLQAILMGTVSHPINDWVGVRGELVKLIQELDTANKKIDRLKERQSDSEDCSICGRPHFLNEFKNDKNN